MPNFLIAGATAAGTSFLTQVLLQHHDIYLPKEHESEPHFFSIAHRYASGIQFYQSVWFKHCDQQKAIGERSSTYFHFPEAAARIKEHLPNIKIILVLRDPIERAFAQYRYMVLRGLEEWDFETAVQLENSRQDMTKRHHEYVGRSLYGKQLELFLQNIPIEQILMIGSEKLQQQTAIQLKRITDFLEIAPVPFFETPSSFSSPTVRDRAVQVAARAHFGKKFRFIIEALRHEQIVPESLVQTDLDQYHLLSVLNNLKSSKEVISEELRMTLKNKMIEDQGKFFKLVKDVVDFEPWLN